MSDRPPWVERLAALQHAHPYRFIAVAYLMGLAALPLILELSLNSDFTAMLPESAQSVRDLDEIQERFGGQQPMNVLVESEDIDAMHRFARELAPRIEAMDELRVVAVDWNVADFERFVETHRHLYAEHADLVEIRDALAARLEYERARANPFFLDLEDEEPPDPEQVLQRMERDAREARERLGGRFPEGFIQHPERPLLVMVVHTTIRGGATEDTDRLTAALDAAIADLDPSSYASDLHVRYGGSLMEIREETASLVAAVRNATLLTVALVMVAIFVFFLRVRPIPLLVLVMIPPVLVTFGIAKLSVDYLNASTAFLSSIVVGNGINASVIWLARYFEARRADEPLAAAILSAHRGTWRATVTAAAAAAVAYGSLIITDYRGFRDFGILGGAGMVLSWIAAYTLLPALAVAFERWRPLRFDKTKEHRGFYGLLFARVALGAPRAVIAVSLVVTVALGGLVVQAIIDDPLEYDFRRLRSTRDPDGDVEYVLEATSEILDETTSGAALAVLAPSRAEIPRLRAQMLEYGERFPRDVGAIKSVDELLPTRQEDKLELIADLRRLMLEIRPHLEEAQQALVDEHLPPESVVVLTPDDLPSSIARPFSERDGTRGRLLFVEPHPEETGWDGAYMIRWARAARSLRAEGADHPPPVAGTAVVFADILDSLSRDGPRAVGVAFVATCILLFLTFRRGRDRFLTLAALLVGIVWMAGTMAAFGMRLNFLNFLAFPITFGNGVDYAVNVMRRYREEEETDSNDRRAIRDAVEGTGGAVVLCSMTTVIGYVSLYTSTNQALNSFGAAMAISEVTCLLAAVLALPAALWLWTARSSSAGPDAKGDEEPSPV